MVLDMKYPSSGGLTLIASIKMSNRLKRIPILVLCYFSQDREVNALYDAGASSVLEKPSSRTDFDMLAEALIWYWCKLNAPPTLLQATPRSSS